MTSDEFRKISLSLSDTAEISHMGHPDFRVRGKIFASLAYPDEGWGMVKLTPEEQAVLIAAEPAIFAPAKGAWGQKGSTLVRLSVARTRSSAMPSARLEHRRSEKTRSVSSREKRA